MKIKVGQWVREDNKYFGRIIKFTGEYSGMYRTKKYDMEQQFLLDYKHNLRVNEYCNIKVADTPQELIQVGDLIKTTLLNGHIFEIDSDYWLTDCLKNNVLKTITAIYTKDEQGNYIKQWEKE
jgi:hypothetical protein